LHLNRFLEAQTVGPVARAKSPLRMCGSPVPTQNHPAPYSKFLFHTPGSVNVASMLAASRDFSPDFRAPMRAKSAQVPAHGTPTHAGRATATGSASSQFEFPKSPGSPVCRHAWRNPISRGSVGERTFAREACVGQRHGRPAEHYQIAEMIGKGIFGVVNLVHCRHGETSRCMKTVFKQDAVDHGMAAVLVVEEAERLTKLDHPSIIRIFEYYTDAEAVYIVTDLLQGGTVFKVLIDQIFALAPVTEHWVHSVFQQVCEGVAHAHSRGVMHKDLKLDNLMLTTADPPQAVVIDWGFAEVFPASEAETFHSANAGGTISTMAPEVIKRRFTCRCDVWSLGCCLWGLLCRRPTAFRKPSGSVECHPYPFTPPEGRSKMELDDYLGQMFLGPDLQCFGGTAGARDLLGKLLIFDQRHRPNMQQVLAHPWFSRPRERTLSDVHVGGLRKFLHSNVVEKVALLEKACNVPIDEIGEISAIFRSLQDLDGTVSSARLAQAMQQSGIEPVVAHELARQCSKQDSVEFSLLVAATFSDACP